jgi:Sec-independent protein translocase protein TatA
MSTIKLSIRDLKKLISEAVLLEAKSADTTKFYNVVRTEVKKAAKDYGKPKTKEQIKTMQRLKSVYTIFQKPEDSLRVEQIDFAVEQLEKIEAEDVRFTNMIKPTYDAVRNFRKAWKSANYEKEQAKNLEKEQDEDLLNTVIEDSGFEYKLDADKKTILVIKTPKKGAIPNNPIRIDTGNKYYQPIANKMLEDEPNFKKFIKLGEKSG